MINNRFCPYCGVKLLSVKTIPGITECLRCETCHCVFEVLGEFRRLELHQGIPPLEPELDEVFMLGGHKLQAVKPHIDSCRYCWCMSKPGFKGFCKQIKCGWGQREDKQPIILEAVT